jgi:transposase
MDAQPPASGCATQCPATGGGKVSTIGALALTGFRTGLSVSGAIDGETLVFFIEELLAPTLNRGDLVFMDNCPIHKMDEIEDIIEACGAWVLFLPPYSPDLNPIEHGWSKVKTRLRALKPRTLEEVLTALVDAFATVTAQDIRGWFRHCGYRVAHI